jgi:hypothetical protein
MTVMPVSCDSLKNEFADATSGKTPEIGGPAI